jgi:hypothetical protein
MGDILPDGTIQGYQGICPKCRATIDTNMQGTEMGTHNCVRRIILHKLSYISKELQKYNEIDVEVEVIKEYRRGIFHVVFPCGFRTDRNGEGNGRIIAFDANNDYAKMWSEVNYKSLFY